MAVLENRKYFLLEMNKLRSSGNLEIPSNIFNYFVKIFSEICKQLCLIQKKGRH